jgi:hypothetical protein
LLQEKVGQVCLTTGHQRLIPLLGATSSWRLRTKKVTFCKQRYYLHAVKGERCVFDSFFGIASRGTGTFNSFLVNICYFRIAQASSENLTIVLYIATWIQEYEYDLVISCGISGSGSGLCPIVLQNESNTHLSPLTACK